MPLRRMAKQDGSIGRGYVLGTTTKPRDCHLLRLFNPRRAREPVPRWNWFYRDHDLGNGVQRVVGLLRRPRSAIGRSREGSTSRVCNDGRHEIRHCLGSLLLSRAADGDVPTWIRMALIVVIVRGLLPTLVMPIVLVVQAGLRGGLAVICWGSPDFDIGHEAVASFFLMHAGLVQSVFAPTYGTLRGLHGHVCPVDRDRHSEHSGDLASRRSKPAHHAWARRHGSRMAARGEDVIPTLAHPQTDTGSLTLRLPTT